MRATRAAAPLGATLRGVAVAGIVGALGACSFGPGGASDPARPATTPVRIRVEMLGGFPATDAPLPAPRVALLVDSTGSMARGTPAGPSRVRGARAAAKRFIEAFPEEAPPSLWMLGNVVSAKCETPAVAIEGERDELLRTTRRMRARGKGSLAAALAALPGPEQDGYERVVAVSALDDGCGGDLCAAAEDLASRGVRLDLVRIGAAPVPECLADLTQAEPLGVPVPWPTASPVSFHVERAGPDPAILVCGETGGLPVEIAPGTASVVVKVDPPLRLSRSFPAGTRWRLQVIDFPGLTPPERHWRWQAEAVPGAEADAGDGADR